MNNLAWLDDLNWLLGRFSHAGICPDTNSMSKSELWGVYCGLRRLARGRR